MTGIKKCWLAIDVFIVVQKKKKKNAYDTTAYDIWSTLHELRTTKAWLNDSTIQLRTTSLHGSKKNCLSTLLKKWRSAMRLHLYKNKKRKKIVNRHFF